MIDLVEMTFERAIVEDGVDLLVAWSAQRHAVLGAAATRFGLQVMKRDQTPGHLTQAKQALVVIIHSQQV